jgi:hypothetical protein
MRSSAAEEDAIDAVYFAVASDDAGLGEEGRGLPAPQPWSGGGDDDFGRRSEGICSSGAYLAGSAEHIIFCLCFC